VMASLAVSHTNGDLEFEGIAFAGSLDLDHSLPSPNRFNSVVVADSS
jgi:hypothetical protein